MWAGTSYVVWLANAKFSYLSRTFPEHDYEPHLIRRVALTYGNSNQHLWLEWGLHNFDLTYVWPVNWPFWLVNQSIDHSNISLLERATFTPQEALLSPLQKNYKLFSNIWYLVGSTLLSYMQLVWQLYLSFDFSSKLSLKMVQMTSFLLQFIKVSLTGQWSLGWLTIQKVWMVIDWSLNGKVPALAGGH